MSRLTTKRLEAIEEALNARLAGEIDVDVPRDAYEGALEWVVEQLRRRASALTER
jgi:hypothetical protein